ncbi:hypothetical protein CGMCC3_g9449 [Colletotrichum fructicola]|uniref:Uncharacterized protein n=1 Tax=Colletotrichum fructicola (strain Nara gc5) TaxID=1213859 RepID=L2FMR6_COLFN|nr:uncharacterized protein CGMCC3_g9449 [Colletotrichum fructicola]KAF4474380.1 hypothetical protein CGGC5_v016537 [Colletotrichum fructicola Nara gc5]KAE9574295.1 hypothetical protein CGMCC3_g9449 [Colletotrichum fructicola]KAF4431581.1 hypothetical protein CFRS1_v011089 [Colletotrichum fructicola]KAF4898807.1 hypothetical protein CGCFRS4_v004272 [Colletotrichum fructicola]KAF4929722.1 hypothetical protein CGCF245_v012049 [Colletotrichum fructicola]
MSSPAHQPQYGLQGYQPYEHQGHQRVIPYSKPWHIAKIVMRCSDIVFSLIVIGISAYVLTIAFSGGAFYVMSWLPAAVAIIWDTAELITICARGGRRGIHPGAHVGLHLIFWLCFAAAVGLQGTYIYFRDVDDYYYSYSSRRQSFFRTKVVPMQNTITAFTALLLINHFILFVRACVETNQRNSRPPVFMVPVNAPPPMQSQAVAGSYVPYPHQPQQAYIPAQQQDKGEQAAASSPSNAGQYVPPGPDGTYYGPASR